MKAVALKPYEFDTDQLLDLAREGDHSAQRKLLERHRVRLRRMVAALIDPRVSARIDPSDVLQDAIASAALKLPEYLKEQPVAFYPWLRRIVKEELIDVHRRHIRAQRRSVNREHIPYKAMDDASAMHLANHLVGHEPSPSAALNLQEQREAVQLGLQQLGEGDRELLLMRFVEQLKIREIADVLDIPVAAARSRVRRAIERLSDHVDKRPSQ